jgi:hypothetical protein
LGLYPTPAGWNRHSAKEYETTCHNMIAKYRTLLNTMQDTVPDVRAFMQHYNMDCPAAANRLIVSGIPATIEHGNTGCVVMSQPVAITPKRAGKPVVGKVLLAGPRH